MTATIIDGKQVAADIRAELKAEVATLKAKGIVPGLGVILVGDDPASNSYVTAKERTCEELGIYSDDNRLPADTSQDELMALIGKMNADPRINGILVQLPLPKHMNESEVLFAIDPDKDVDGFHPVSVGKMVVGEKAFLSCTPHGVLHLLIRSGVKIDGAHVVIVGRSNIVGVPVAALLQNADATVTTCHSRTKDLPAKVRQADIVVAAIGRPEFVKAEWLKPGCAVIDVGINAVPDATKKSGQRLVGDVAFAEASEVAGWITPVPGGVGPMTIAMLLKNTVRAYRLQHDMA